MRKSTIAILSLAAVIAGGLIFAACGSGGGSSDSGGTGGGTTGGSGSPKTGGKVSLDGSSTVYPIAQALGEDYHKSHGEVNVDVTSSGTGSGFAKFERGEIDIANASRPIEQKEADACKAAKIDFVEIPIAADGVCVLVNSGNSFASQMTLDEIKKAFGKGSTVKTWADIHAGWPTEPIKFYGPTSNHGTFDYFTETVLGKKGDIRDDVVQNQDYNALITAIAGDKNALGYVGFSFYEEKKDQVKALSVDAGHGPIAPSLDSIKDNSYAPLARPLFMYVSTKALARPEVKDFFKYAFTDEGKKAITDSDYVLLPDEAYAIDQKLLDGAKTGSLFMTAKAGVSTLDVLKSAK